jgi:hypothetical protein
MYIYDQQQQVMQQLKDGGKHDSKELAKVKSRKEQDDNENEHAEIAANPYFFSL